MGAAQLVAVTRRPSPAARSGKFPFTVPAVATLKRLEISSQVTFLVGENGSGKSTFLEALAIACELPAVGSARLETDPTLARQRELAKELVITWRRRNRRGFFLRAEDFFGFQRKVARTRSDHEAELVRVDEEFAEASDLARTLARGTHLASLGALTSAYGSDPDARSHGEAFLNLFAKRLSPRGLFLLDEPEAALSPQSQLGFMSMLKAAVDDGSQFVIATHSPILMAIPGADLLSFDEVPIVHAAFDDLEPVNLVRDFLNAPERYLNHIWT